MMKYILLIWLFLLCTASTAHCGTEVTNTEELINLLTTGHSATKNEKASSWGGCEEQYPDDCSAHIDKLTISQKRETIQRADGKRIKLIQHAPEGMKNLPEMDWDPIEGLKVFRAGMRWGACFRFGHTGLGKSGSFQRWRSIVLVPWKGSKPGLIAHRFFGYWADCALLLEGEKKGEVMLPIIEPVKIGSSGLHLIWKHCAADGCERVEDSRIIDRDSDGEAEVLVIGETSEIPKNK